MRAEGRDMMDAEEVDMELETKDLSEVVTITQRT